MPVQAMIENAGRIAQNEANLIEMGQGRLCAYHQRIDRPY